jgi:hypothetical protein
VRPAVLLEKMGPSHDWEPDAARAAISTVPVDRLSEKDAKAELMRLAAEIANKACVEKADEGGGVNWRSRKMLLRCSGNGSSAYRALPSNGGFGLTLIVPN